MELKLITYIKKHGLEKTLTDFSLKSKDYGHKVIIKYDQIGSNFTDEEVREARGIILEKGTWKIMSWAFYKFFNSEEGHCAKVDFDNAKILEKCDGCCHEDTILVTEDGEKTIKEICDTKYNGKVKSFDLENKEIFFDKIVDYSIKKNINDWYEIELEDGTKVKLTATHKVWLPKLKCYRRVDELTEEDEFLLDTKKI